MVDRNQDVDPERVIYCEKHKYEVKKICTLKECKDRFICIMCRHDNSHERFISKYSDILDELLYSDIKNLIIKAIQISSANKCRDTFKQIHKKLNLIQTKTREKMETDIRKQFEDNLRKFFDIRMDKVMKKCQLLEEENVEDIIRKKDLIVSKIKETLRETEEPEMLYDYFDKFFNGGILSKIIEEDYDRYEKFSTESFEEGKKQMKRILEAVSKDELENLIERKEEKNQMIQKVFNNSVIDFRNQSLVDGVMLDGSVNNNRQEPKKIENYLEVNQHKIITYWDNCLSYYTCMFASKECKEEFRKSTRDKCYTVWKVCMPCISYDFLLTLEPTTDIIKLWNIRERDFEKITDLLITVEGITRQLLFIGDTKPQTFRDIVDYEKVDKNTHSYSSLNFIRLNDRNKLEIWEIVMSVIPKVKKDSFHRCSMVFSRDFEGEISYIYYDKYDDVLFVIVKDQKVYNYTFNPVEKSLVLNFEPSTIIENHGKVLHFSKVNTDQYCYLTSLDRLVVINVEITGLKIEALSLFRNVSWGATYGLNKYAVCYLNEALKKYSLDILEVNEKRWKNAEVILDEKMGLGTLIGDRKEIIYDKGGVITFFVGK